MEGQRSLLAACRWLGMVGIGHGHGAPPLMPLHGCLSGLASRAGAPLGQMRLCSDLPWRAERLASRPRLAV